MPVYIPPERIVIQVLPQLRTFIAKLSRAYFPPDTRITSWFRSVRQNLAVGGDSRSQHLAGLALDLVTVERAHLVDQLRLVGLVAVDEGDHVHVQALPREQSPIARIALV